jgi:arylsulfatase
MNTPFQWGKQSASHLGGTRNPMAVAWPARVKASRDQRTQFTRHRPRLDCPRGRGHPEPKTVDGIEQEPMDGTSFLYTFEDAGAVGATTQHFEMFAIARCTRDGWWLRPDRSVGFVAGDSRRFGPGSGWDG